MGNTEGPDLHENSIHILNQSSRKSHNISNQDKSYTNDESKDTLCFEPKIIIKNIKQAQNAANEAPNTNKTAENLKIRTRNKNSNLPISKTVQAPSFKDYTGRTER